MLNKAPLLFLLLCSLSSFSQTDSTEGFKQRLSTGSFDNENNGEKCKISGQIIDDVTGLGIPFATIQIKDSDKGTTTDLDGNFFIKAQKGQLLVIRMVGYETQEFLVGGDMTDIKLSLKNETLKEMVVVGYGSQESEDVTGSIVKVEAEQIAQTAVAGAAGALQGRAAGVEVVNTNGQPGPNAEVRIRGLGSINGSPVLYVVDGMPLDGPAVNAVAPQDIASINILKDASAAAIYGARAAGGVILITTKRGKKGKPKVTFDSYYGVQSLVKKMNVMDASQYATAFNYDDYLNGTSPDSDFNDPNSLGKGTDWQDLLFPGGAIFNAHVNVSGGSEKTTYAMSLDYFDEKGVVPETFWKRFSFRNNLDFELSKHIKFGSSLAITRDGGKGTSLNSDRPENNMMLAAIALDPTIDPVRPFATFPDTLSLVPEDHQLYSSTDSLAWMNTPRGNTRNPLAQLYRNKTKYGMTWYDKILTNNYIEIKPFKWLTLKSIIGCDYSNANGWFYNPVYFIDANDKNDIDGLGHNHDQWFSSNWENTIEFKHNFGNHNFNLLGGTTAFDWRSKGFSFYKNYLGGSVNNEVSDNMLLSNTGEIDPNFNEGSNGFMYRRYSSTFGRFNYEYNDKYFLTATIRRDGSSRFGYLNKFGVFPGFSGGWKIHNEGFFKNLQENNGLDFISFLKLRGGYGQLGNSEPAGDFAYNGITSVNSSNVIFGPDGTTTQVQGSTIDFAPNPALRWETIGMSNFALDIGLLMNKLWITAEYYIKKTSDMIMDDNSILSAHGIGGAARTNIGDMENRGIDLSISYSKMEGEFNYSLTTNISRVKNKIIKLSNNLDQVIEGGSFHAMEYYTRTTIGSQIGEFWGYEVQGIFQSDIEAQALTYIDENLDEQNTYGPTVGAGDYQFVDQNGDGQINESDKKKIGSPYPDFTLGFTSDFSYKGFDLNLFMYWSYGNEIFNTLKVFTETPYEQTNMNSYMLEDAWRPDNTSATIAQLGGDRSNNYSKSSTAFIENGSFLRFKNISLGYTIPQNISRIAKIEKLRFYVALQNYFTITKYSGRDPELGGGVFVQKNDMGNYTVPRTLNFGINATF
jgi:TonB-linked SusC/RagA family outer membrane protein